MDVYSKIYHAMNRYHHTGGCSPSVYDECAWNLIHAFSWIIPNEKAFELFKGHKRIIEIGAGRGYWAKHISKYTDIECFDLHPQHNTFYPVSLGGPEVLREYGNEWALFICSPQYRSDMVLESLRYFQGDQFIYAGDVNFGMNLPSVKTELENNWNIKTEIELPNWPNSSNKLVEYVRRM